MRLKFQKRNALKFASRISPRSEAEGVRKKLKMKYSGIGIELVLIIY